MAHAFVGHTPSVALSNHDFSATSLAAQVEHAIEFVDAAKSHYKHVVAIAHSVGAWVALQVRLRCISSDPDHYNVTMSGAEAKRTTSRCGFSSFSNNIAHSRHPQWPSTFGKGLVKKSLYTITEPQHTAVLRSSPPAYHVLLVRSDSLDS